MPVPLLPLELIRLIAEYVVDDLDEHAGRAECFRLARVCKAWGALVQPLAWRTLTIDPGIDMRSLDYVLEHPEVLRIVEVVDAYCLRLSANDQVTLGEISEPQAARLVALLRSCTSLTDLKLAPCAASYRLLAATSVLPLASSLKTLTITFDVDTLHFEFLVSSLARFAGLRTLHLFIECDEIREVVSDPSTAITTITLNELKSERPWTLLLDALAAMSAPLVCRIGGLFFQASSAAYSVHRDPVTVTDRFSLLGRAVTLIAFAWSDDEDDEWFVALEDEFCGVPVRFYYIPDEGATGHKRWYRVSSSADDADDD